MLGKNEEKVTLKQIKIPNIGQLNAGEIEKDKIFLLWDILEKFTHSKAGYIIIKRDYNYILKWQKVLTD